MVAMILFWLFLSLISASPLPSLPSLKSFVPTIPQLPGSLRLNYTSDGYATDISQVDNTIYQQLYRAANFTSVAYCASPYIKDGIRAGKDFSCKLKFCLENRNVYEIIQVFEPVAPEFFSGTGFVAISHVTKEIIVSFRGTMSVIDAVTDISLGQVPYVPITPEANANSKKCIGCRVHMGFYNSMKTTFSDVFPLVQQLKMLNMDYNILLTGHSMGGAMANLAGIEFKLQGWNPLVVSLAGPKVGNKAMADFTDEIFQTDLLDKQFRNGSISKLQTGFWRVVQQQDYVPLIPPGKDYSHAGLEFVIKEVKPLPPLENLLVYLGLYKYEALVKSISWNKVVFFDIFHVYQHLHYFGFQSACLLTLFIPSIPFLTTPPYIGGKPLFGWLDSLSGIDFYPNNTKSY